MSDFQVVFGYGNDGLAKYAAHADVIFWVNGLGTPTEAANPVIAQPGTAFLSIALSNWKRAAAWSLDYQMKKQKRLLFCVICAHGYPEVADQMIAGGLIDGLADLGIDAISPEAALVNAAYTQLGKAMTHLITASENGDIPSESAATSELEVQFL